MSIFEIEFTENVRAFFLQRQSKLSVVMRCPHQAGVCKGRFDCILLRNHFGHFLVFLLGFLRIRSTKIVITIISPLKQTFIVFLTCKLHGIIGR